MYTGQCLKSMHLRSIPLLQIFQFLLWSQVQNTFNHRYQKLAKILTGWLLLNLFYQNITFCLLIANWLKSTDINSNFFFNLYLFQVSLFPLIYLSWLFPPHLLTCSTRSQPHSEVHILFFDFRCLLQAPNLSIHFSEAAKLASHWPRLNAQMTLMLPALTNTPIGQNQPKRRGWKGEGKNRSQ